VLNPNFAKYVLKQMGVEKEELPFEDVATKAYNMRVAEFKERA
jgi:hypothetical protein